ncbi:MAG TPA: hypothetical protein VF702_01795 [Allosphingosinicella sp.]|jgi:hypothetical protein
MKTDTALRLGGALTAALLLGGCQPSVADMDCAKIAEESVRIWGEAKDRPLRVTAIAKEREVSRSEKEARCVGEATLSDNRTTPVNMRAYEADNGTVVVESGDTPFAEPPR